MLKVTKLVKPGSLTLELECSAVSLTASLSQARDIQTCLCELLVSFSLSGNLFLEFQEELERVYKFYCANYDQALLLLESYRREPELQREIQGVIESVM